MTSPEPAEASESAGESELAAVTSQSIKKTYDEQANEKIALIAVAGSSIGRAIAELSQNQSATVASADLNEESFAEESRIQNPGWKSFDTV